jgi:hypothetical protein
MSPTKSNRPAERSRLRRVAHRESFGNEAMSAPVISYVPFDELIASLRADGLDGEADRLHDLLHKTAWTTGSELVGELGREMKRLEREQGTRFSAATDAKFQAAFKMVRRVWPRFPK